MTKTPLNQILKSFPDPFPFLVMEPNLRAYRPTYAVTLKAGSPDPASPLSEHRSSVAKAPLNPIRKLFRYPVSCRRQVRGPGLRACLFGVSKSGK